MVLHKELKGPVVECVPNFSEGKSREIIETIKGEIDSVRGIKVLDTHSDIDHNRSVITFIGGPKAVVEASVAAVRSAARLIDLTKHTGVHPRIGATDVLPLIPIRDITMEECVELARDIAKRIWRETDVPTYLYGYAATRDDRQRLEKVRSRGFEQMRELVRRDDGKRPDFGGPELHPTAGATIVGARDPLIAFNVNLRSQDLNLAIEIANEVREKRSGFTGVKALGLMLSSDGCVQISTNITKPDLVSPFAVFDKIRIEAEKRGLEICESELVGLMPLGAVLESTRASLRLESFDRSRVIELNL